MTDIDNKAKAVKLFVTDVDGVMTDGRLIFNEHGLAHKEFHVHDGVGLQSLQKTGIKIAVITTCTAAVTRTRMEYLGFDDIYLGQRDKRQAFQDLLDKYQLDAAQTAYIGDDLPDLPLIQRAGLGIIVANATPALKPYADWQTQRAGGHGAVREACDRIMHAQDTFNDFTQSFLS